MEEEYRGYRLNSVYKNISPSLHDEIITLWTENGAIPLDEAERRVQEVVYIVRNSSGILAGVSTAYLQRFLPEEDLFYFMRMFIRPEDRGYLGLHRLLSRRTREHLKTFRQLDITPKGVVIIIENPKYLQRGNRISLEERGWTYYGQGPKGNHIWYECFDGSHLLKPA